MKAYGIQQGQLVKLADSLEEMDDGTWTSVEPDQLLEMGWIPRFDISDAFQMYVAEYPGGDDFHRTELLAYQWMFVVNAGGSGEQYVLLVRDDLADYLAAHRLLEPLVNVSTFLELESEFYRRQELAERQARQIL